jgi:hypothetical protein
LTEFLDALDTPKTLRAIVISGTYPAKSLVKTVAAAFSIEGVLFDHHPNKGIAPKMRCLMDGQELPAALLKFLLRMISNLASDLEERRVGRVWRLRWRDDLEEGEEEERLGWRSMCATSTRHRNGGTKALAW